MQKLRVLLRILFCLHSPLLAFCADFLFSFLLLEASCIRSWLIINHGSVIFVDKGFCHDNIFMTSSEQLGLPTAQALYMHSVKD